MSCVTYQGRHGGIVHPLRHQGMGQLLLKAKLKLKKKYYKVNLLGQ